MNARTTEVSSVEVNAGRLRQLARLMRDWSIPRDHEDASLDGFTREEIGNFYFSLVAICHQTSPKGIPPLEGDVDGRHLRGWDFLLGKLESASRQNRALLSPETWRQFDRHAMRELYGPRLTHPEGRAALVRDLGETLSANGWACAECLYEAAERRVAIGGPNLLELLSRFHAFRDPVFKKSYFFLSIMRNSGCWSYADPENIGPPVDYHEVRGHLRIGTVVIQDAELEAKVRRGVAVTEDEDVSIRRAVHDAIMLLSRETGINNPSRLHYLFWNVFRSDCTRDDANCRGHRASTLPERYRHLSGTGASCPFASICGSADLNDRITEHIFETDYY